jgi:hypothetical protein
MPEKTRMSEQNPSQEIDLKVNGNQQRPQGGDPGLIYAALSGQRRFSPAGDTYYASTPPPGMSPFFPVKDA